MLAVEPFRAPMQAKTVKDGGNARRRTLAIMGQRSPNRIPLGAGAGLKMFLKIVGMDINQTRDQEVIAEVFSAESRFPCGDDIANQAIFDHQIAANGTRRRNDLATK
jgi:hypothetical protein